MCVVDTVSDLVAVQVYHVAFAGSYFCLKLHVNFTTTKTSGFLRVLCNPGPQCRIILRREFIARRFCGLCNGSDASACTFWRSYSMIRKVFQNTILNGLLNKCKRMTDRVNDLDAFQIQSIG